MAKLYLRVSLFSFFLPLVPALSLDSNTVWGSQLPMDFDICIGPMKKKKCAELHGKRVKARFK
jgi:hypothetical protein